MPPVVFRLAQEGGSFMLHLWPQWLGGHNKVLLLDVVRRDVRRNPFPDLKRLCSNSAIILYAHVDHVASSAP